MDPMPVAVRLLLLLRLGCTAELGPGADSGSSGSPGGGAVSTSGDGGGAQAATGGSSTTATCIDLPGEPNYYRFVRLTNSQWAHSVSDILRLAQPSGLEGG